MNQGIIRQISQEIYRRFPEFKGVNPKVKEQSATQAKALSGSPHYLLTYQSVGYTPEKRSLSRIVRVVVDEHGKILRITTSH